MALLIKGDSHESQKPKNNIFEYSRELFTGLFRTELMNETSF